MYRKNYLNYLFFNILGSLFAAFILFYPQNLMMNKIIMLIAWLMGILLMHYLIIQLPIFNKYYLNRKKLKKYIIRSSRSNYASDRTAPVMSSFVTAFVFGLGLWLVGITEFFFEYAFFAGISTGMMSYYYAPS